MYLTDLPIDTRALRNEVLRRSDGAVVAFEGVVRDHQAGRQVDSIFYEAYRPMAEKEIGKVVRVVEAEFPAVAVAVQHRLGELAVGEVSIAIVCSSPHRAEAYAASRAVIDRIKTTVPIWKKERGPGGDEWAGWQ